ncbi:MAG: glycoside hydrolase domain-containing protein [Planctomycetota bacterium]
MRWRRWTLITLATTAGLLIFVNDGTRTVAESAGGEPSPVAVTGAGDAVLNNATIWRVRVVREEEEVLLPSGEIEHCRISWGAPDSDGSGGFAKKFPEGRYRLDASRIEVAKRPTRRIPAETSSEWVKPDFDDSGWDRSGAPILHVARQPEWKLVLLRTRFSVVNPSDLTLSMTYKGGVVVYLNGEELTRKDLLDGKHGEGMHGLAKPDDEGAYTAFGDRLPSWSTKGGLWRIQYLDGAPKELVEKRTRRLADFKIPAGKLKKGVNVLAVAIHRSVAPWQFYATCDRRRVGFYYDSEALWGRAGLHEVSLIGGGVVPNVSASQAGKLRAWNATILRKVWQSDYGDPSEGLNPVYIVGARNGRFAGQVVIENGGPIRGLKVTPSNLSGPGNIPAANVTILYAQPDGSVRGECRAFDMLEEEPPAEIAPGKGRSGALQPLWITVKIPADAKPGIYTGEVAVTAQEGSLKVPLKVEVVGWTLPDYREFAAYMDMFQSPESLAMAYEVPMWSEAHWKLIERSLTLMGPMASKSLYLTCIRRTHLGNEHAMIRWKKGADGKLEPDLSIASRYLDLAVKHWGKVPSVVLYGWEPPYSAGHGNVEVEPSWIHDREIMITVVGADGALAEDKAPAWETPECAEFWKKLLDGMQKEMDKHGISKSMLFGLMGDHLPTAAAVEAVRKARPDLEWACHSHFYRDKWHGQEIGFSAAVWGVKCYPCDPLDGYGYGWRNAFRLLHYPRGDLNSSCSLANFRLQIEQDMGAKPWDTNQWRKSNGIRGLGRQGADFWPVLKDASGRPSARLAARYPDTAWGQLCINYGNPDYLGKGRTGPVPTARSEMIRENVQEIEARVLIEKALLDEARKAKLGDELAKLCREAMDERILLCLYGVHEGEPWVISSGVPERMKKLFGLAAEVAAKIGGK